jgi:hypothetical protein
MVGSGPEVLADGTGISSPTPTVSETNSLSMLKQVISMDVSARRPPLKSSHVKPSLELISSQELLVDLNLTLEMSAPTVHCPGGGSIALQSLTWLSLHEIVT